MNSDQDCAAFIRAIASAHEWLTIAPRARVNASGFLGVTATELAAMLRIGEDGVHMEELRTGWGGAIASEERRGGSISRQAVSQLVSSLKEAGYVEVEASSIDQRQKIVFPTDDGVSLVWAGMEAKSLLHAELGDLVGPDLRSVTTLLRDLVCGLAMFGKEADAAMGRAAERDEGVVSGGSIDGD